MFYGFESFCLGLNICDLMQRKNTFQKESFYICFFYVSSFYILPRQQNHLISQTLLYFTFTSSSATDPGSSSQESPDCPLPSVFHQLFRGHPKAFPGQLGDIVCLHCALGPPLSWGCLKHLPREASRRHPDHMLKSPKPTPLDVEELVGNVT